MKRLRPQGGFTLIEVTIVMAITTLALLSYMAGTGSQRQQTQFSVDIDTLVNKMKILQNEAQNGVSYRGTTEAGPGGLSKQKADGTTGYAYYGKQLEFWPAGASGDPTGLYTWTLVKIPTPTSNCSGVGGENAVLGAYGNGLCQVNRNFVPFGGSLKYVGSSYYGAPNSGSLTGLCANPWTVFVYSPTGRAASIGTPACSDYSTILPEQVTTIASYYFQDLSDPNRTATITVNPKANTVSSCLPTTAQWIVRCR